MRAVKFIMVPVLLAGCTTVQRGPALTLAENGHAVAASGQATVVDFAASVDSAVELQLIDSVVTGQQAMAIDDPLNVGLLQSGRNLSDLVRLRGRALGALAGAYDALADEANDDAPAAMGAAVAKLTDSATAFATAAGLGAPAIALASGVINSLAKEAAASAQQRRLILASRQIAAATNLIADAIDKEAELYARVAASLGKDRQNFVATLMAKGIADPSPTVRDFVRRQGLEPLPVPPALAVPMAQSRCGFATGAPSGRPPTCMPPRSGRCGRSPPSMPSSRRSDRYASGISSWRSPSLPAGPNFTPKRARRRRRRSHDDPRRCLRGDPQGA